MFSHIFSHWIFPGSKKIYQSPTLTSKKAKILNQNLSILYPQATTIHVCHFTAIFIELLVYPQSLHLPHPTCSPESSEKKNLFTKTAFIKRARNVFIANTMMVTCLS